MPITAACYGRADAEPALETAGGRSPVHVDSVFPIEEEIRRFRETLSDEPRELAEDAPRSRDELVSRFVQAIERSDTAAATALMITRAEFGYLYFQHSPHTRPPYKMSPTLLWFLTVRESEKGLSRTLSTYGGSRMGFRGYLCAREPAVEGPNRIWRDCVLELRSRNTDETRRLFGAILEREGRYKFLSFSSDF